LVMVAVSIGAAEKLHETIFEAEYPEHMAF
jgi:hypothetical protein